MPKPSTHKLGVILRFFGIKFISITSTENRRNYFRYTMICFCVPQRNVLLACEMPICIVHLARRLCLSTAGRWSRACRQPLASHSPRLHHLNTDAFIYLVTLLVTAQKRPLETLLTTTLYEASFVTDCLS
jgi:hypothetical protein